MSSCELQTEVGQLYATVKQLAITTEELKNEIVNLRKDYTSIIVSNAHLQTQVNYIANCSKPHPPTPESPRSPPTLSTEDDRLVSSNAWSM